VSIESSRLARALGDLPAARASCLEALAQLAMVGDRSDLVGALIACAAVAAAEGRPLRAARIAGATAALETSTGASPSPGAGAEREQILAAIRHALDTDTFAAEWAAGVAMLPEQAVGYARETISGGDEAAPANPA